MEPTRAQLMQALRRADESGDTAAAKAIARKLAGSQADEYDPT